MASPTTVAMLIRRPFGARRRQAKPDIDRSDSSPEFVTARSVCVESASAVHAAPADARISYYSRRRRHV
jgi:hypothetical protein